MPPRCPLIPCRQRDRTGLPRKGCGRRWVRAAIHAGNLIDDILSGYLPRSATLSKKTRNPAPVAPDITSHAAAPRRSFPAIPSGQPVAYVARLLKLGLLFSLAFGVSVLWSIWRSEYR